MLESPRRDQGRLWFSDWIAGQIIALDDAGVSELIVRHESLPLCFDFLPGGTLVLVSNQDTNNPWMVGGYFLSGLVDKDAVRRANNNLLMRSDELRVAGPTSDGVDVEVTWAQQNDMPVRWFDLDHYGEAIRSLSARPCSA